MTNTNKVMLRALRKIKSLLRVMEMEQGLTYYPCMAQQVVDKALDKVKKAKSI